MGWGKSAQEEQDRIIISEIPCMVRLGVADEERRQPQKVLIDVELELGLTSACSSDDIRDTVDYSRLVDELQERLEKAEFHLLEALAQEACRVALDDARVQRTRVRVRKFPQSLAGRVCSVAVELTRECRV